MAQQGIGFMCWRFCLEMSRPHLLNTQIYHAHVHVWSSVSMQSFPIQKTHSLQTLLLLHTLPMQLGVLKSDPRVCVGSALLL